MVYSIKRKKEMCKKKQEQFKKILDGIAKTVPL